MGFSTHNTPQHRWMLHSFSLQAYLVLPKAMGSIMGVKCLLFRNQVLVDFLLVWISSREPQKRGAASLLLVAYVLSAIQEYLK